MLGQTGIPCQLRLAADWVCRIDEMVEIRNGDEVIRRGIVEAVMADGSGLWLAANGTDHRAYFHKEIGVELWVRH